MKAVFHCVATVGLLLATVPASAHHSFAMYDQTQTLTFTGKLTRFIPGANHAQLLFQLVDANGVPVVDASGKPVSWGVEAGPVARIAKQGVTPENFPDLRTRLINRHRIFTGEAKPNVIRLLPSLALSQQDAEYFIEVLKSEIQ